MKIRLNPACPLVQSRYHTTSHHFQSTACIFINFRSAVAVDTKDVGSRSKARTWCPYTTYFLND
eukprot:scaffold294_cov221-Amphora_coffeaeformis.AAC.28